MTEESESAHMAKGKGKKPRGKRKGKDKGAGNPFAGRGDGKEKGSPGKGYQTEYDWDEEYPQSQQWPAEPAAAMMTDVPYSP